MASEQHCLHYVSMGSCSEAGGGPPASFDLLDLTSQTQHALKAFSLMEVWDKTSTLRYQATTKETSLQCRNPGRFSPHICT